MIYRYKSYSEIPETVASYLLNVAGIKNIMQLSLNEINTFMNDMERWYDNGRQYNSSF
jgi:hypothetical protein